MKKKLETWTERVNNVVKSLESLEPHDRLSCYIVIVQALRGLFMSMKGWNMWVQEPAVFNVFKEHEMLEMANKLRKIVIEFLELDSYVTSLEQKCRSKLVDKMLKERKHEEERPVLFA